MKTWTFSTRNGCETHAKQLSEHRIWLREACLEIRRAMSFWGCIVAPGQSKKVETRAGELLHLSQARNAKSRF